MTATNPPLDPDPPLPVRPTATTHAYWLMPGAVTLGSIPERDRLIGTLALGPPLDSVFHEQIELSRPLAHQEYVHVAGGHHSQRGRGTIRARFVMSVNALVLIVFAGIILTTAIYWLVPSSTALPFPITLLIVVAFIAALAPAWRPRRNRWLRGNPMIRLEEESIEEEPVDVRVRIQARITPPPEVMAREVPLLTCQVCRAARLAYDMRSGMTACPNCGTELPIYHWPIEVPAPDEPLLGIA